MDLELALVLDFGTDLDEDVDIFVALLVLEAFALGDLVLGATTGSGLTGDLATDLLDLRGVASSSLSTYATTST